MKDYDKIWREFWREVQRQEGRIAGDVAAFARDIVEMLRANGYQINDEIEIKLAEQLNAIAASVRTAITASLAAGRIAHDEQLAALTGQAFVRRWNDGLILSQRLWSINRITDNMVRQQLFDAARQGTGVGRIIYDMQRAIEGPNTFEQISDNRVKWVDDLRSSGRALIHNPQAAADWRATVAKVDRYIDKLKTSGTKNASLRLLDQIKEAIDAGRAGLVENAVHWWAYDKQLYNLKRIARTEMATAMHNAVIDANNDNPDVIGYQWRLSSSHGLDDCDICNYYAGIDMGMGRGVWSKEAIPRSKPHPHCLCAIIPRVSHIKTAGSRTYAEFIEKAPDSIRSHLLPQWANAAIKRGVPIKSLIASDGKSIILQATAKSLGLIDN